MGDETTGRHRLFAAALERADWSLRQAWLGYFALGGRCDIFDIEAFVEGLVMIRDHEQDVLAVAFNERLQDLYLEHQVPYLSSSGGGPASSPSAVEALADLFAQADEVGADETGDQTTT